MESLRQNLVKIPPLAFLATGIATSLLLLIFLPFQPPLLVVVIAGFVSLIAFPFQRFFIVGITLGIVAVGLNTSPPYSQAFTDCHYQASLSQVNYGTNSQGKEIRLLAKNIQCQGKKLPNQTLQFWDNQRQFQQFANHRMTVRSDLKPIHASLNLYSFDYEKYLISEGIRLQAKNITILSTQPQRQPILRLRQAFSTAITKHLSRENAAIILALVTGNRSGLSGVQKQTLQQTGSSHILAISGLHLALIGGLAWLIGQWLWALSWRLSDKVMPIQAGAVFAFIVISIYAVLTGFDLPVKRAWVMFSLLIFSWLWLKSLSTNALLIAAIAVMLVSPYSAVSVGFYFSFIATFIVLWCSQLNYPPLIKVLIMQGLINLTLPPITWFVFSSIPLSAFFVNLLIIPWLGLWVLPWAILACVLTMISPTIAQPLWTVVDFSTSALWQSIQIFNDLHWSISPTFTPNLIAVIIAVGSLLLALITKKKWLVLGLLCVFLPIRLPTSPALVVADGRFTSVLIHNGKTAIIINPGRRYRHINKAKKWQRYLQQYGLSLSAIILSDEKISHISATAWLLKQYPQAKVITLKSLFLPYENTYCQSLTLENLTLVTKKQSKNCSASLLWFGQSVDLFPREISEDNHTALTKKSQFIWQGKTYNTQKLGAVTVILDNSKAGEKSQTPVFTVNYERQKKRPWRQYRERR